MKRFIKSADTSTPVSNSKRELERILQRYGASSVGFSEDYDAGIARVSFMVPDDLSGNALQVPVRLEVSIYAVASALQGAPYTHPRKDRGQRWEQAERVAWRHLVLWVDAALSAAAAGVQRISEVFLAHTLVQGQGGRILRMVDQMDEAAGGSWKALLAPPGKT